jgi:hypothetical protein
MGTLIAFILDNFFIVIVILAVLSSLFSRGRRAGGGMPTFGGGDAHPRGREREVRRTGTRTYPPYESRPAAPPQRTSRPAAPEVYRSKFEPRAQREERRAANAEPARSYVSASDTPQRIPDVGRSTPSDRSRPETGLAENAIRDGASPIYRPQDAAELANRARYGLMWSEVFARPRAYRKFNGPRR